MVPEYPPGKVCTRLVGLSLLSALFFAPIAGQAASSVKIYRSTMPDGSVMLGDRPTAGARSVVTGTYVLAAPPGAADAEREYWRRQSEAFDLRQQQREVEAARRSVSARSAGGAAMGAEHVHRFSHQYVTGYTQGYSGGYSGRYSGRHAGGYATTSTLSPASRTAIPVGLPYAPRAPVPIALPHMAQPLVPRRETQHRPVRSPSGSGHRGSGVSGNVPGPVR